MRQIDRRFQKSREHAITMAKTLEEIGIRARKQWMEVGGEDFLLIPCLNAEPRWVEAVADLIHAENEAAAQAAVDTAKASVQQAQAAYDRVKDRPDVEMRQESLNLQNATISLEQAQAMVSR